MCSVLVHVPSYTDAGRVKKSFSWVEMLVSKVAILGLCAILVKMGRHARANKSKNVVNDEDLTMPCNGWLRIK